MKYLKRFNEMLDPMGKWTSDEDQEDSDGEVSEPTPLRYVQFCDWLCNEKDFDFYDGQEDFRNKWSEIANTQMTPSDKASMLTNYLDKKWGLYDGSQEVFDYLKNLFK